MQYKDEFKKWLPEHDVTAAGNYLTYVKAAETIFGSEINEGNNTHLHA